MIITMKRRDVGVIVLYLMSVLMYLTALIVFGWNNEHSLDNLRYVMLVIAIAHGYFLLFLRRKLIFKKDNFGNAILLIYVVAILFFILSVIQAKKVNHALGTRTYIQIALLLIPAMYAYCLLNLLDTRTITKLFEITLLINIFFYIFIDKGLGIFFDLSKYTLISFRDSYSPFETSKNPDQFFCMFAYFNFFRNTATNEKERKEYNFYYILSIIFVVLTFKRLAIVFLPCVLILNKILDMRLELPKFMPLLTALLFTAATYFYTLFMRGASFLGIDVYTFTKGRNYILSLWDAKGLFSYGYGSSYEIINRYLEMDLVQIYLEIGLLAVFVFSFAYFKIAGTNVYAYMLMLYVFFNLLTASSIPYPMGWVLILITIVCVSSDKLTAEQVEVYDKRGWIMKLFPTKQRGSL